MPCRRSVPDSGEDATADVRVTGSPYDSTALRIWSSRA